MGLKHNVLRENWERNLNLIYMQEALAIMRTKTRTLRKPECTKAISLWYSGEDL